ncbi:DNA-binding CsgD family transcriptional regulator [Streptomyces sp. AK010]|nr:DNA-binding CsgD family transcriptional regulator [Streptomyces sp. AK010]
MEAGATGFLVKDGPVEAGATGFLVKDGPVEERAAAIRRVLAGEAVVDPALATAALSAGPSPLTTRESDVLRASADGATVAGIATALHLSESTVRNHLSSAIGKTGTRNRMEAQREARHRAGSDALCAPVPYARLKNAVHRKDSPKHSDSSGSSRIRRSSSSVRPKKIPRNASGV